MKRITLREKKPNSIDLIFLCVKFHTLSPGTQVVLSIGLSVETATQDNETHWQMRNKKVCFAYQLLTISRVEKTLAFGCCCLWLCRCKPSYFDFMLMGPFPLRENYTVTFGQWHLPYPHLTVLTVGSTFMVRIIWSQSFMYDTSLYWALEALCRGARVINLHSCHRFWSCEYPSALLKIFH